ncbi:MAG: DNA-processing protein DprA [Candidatus Gracilibacteria bacterium]|nr:DNA-processing protein DprA [Candidatus Gracilibacteria bacterium]
MSDLIYLASLHSIGISQKKLNKIFESNSNYKNFYEQLGYENLQPFFTSSEIEKILSKKERFDINKLSTIIVSNNIEIVTIHDVKYPKLLKQIVNSPYLFYLIGEIDNSPKIAVIGSRGMTLYGKRAIEKIVPSLTKYFTIVSGGAMGCDSEAHKQTIKSKGKTIVVVGTGIDVVYPAGNKILYDNVVTSNGGIISIFPIGEQANVYTFPIRNEIIAALSSGVLVVESGEKSGTLITVNLALEQGKDIFAIPGELFKINSMGCNNLIKNGSAKIVTNVDDIFEEYNINTLDSLENINQISFANEVEKIIYNVLLLENLDIDLLLYKTNLSLNDITVNLSMMEIKGIIKKGLNGKYEIN